MDERGSMTPADVEREARAKAHELLGDFGGCVSLPGDDEHSLPCERTTAFVAAHATEAQSLRTASVDAMAGWADMIKRAAGMAERHAAEVAALRGALGAVAWMDDDERCCGVCASPLLVGCDEDCLGIIAREALASSPAAVDGGGS